MQKIYKHPLFGEILIKKRAGSSRIRVAINPKKGISVTIPLLTPYSAAVSFIDEIEEKIVKVMAKQNENMSKKMVEITPDTVIKTVCREISFKPSDRAEIKVVLYNNAAIIEYPINADLSELEPFLKEAVIKILRHEAKEFLPKRLKELADKHGFTYNRLALKNNSSNWGSCSGKNNINLNIHLMRTSAEICDFVILHELAHLRHRNHGDEFHRLLNSLCGGRERELSAKLRKYSTFF